MIDTYLKYIFYGLMCLPVLAAGMYFFMQMCSEIRAIGDADEKIRAEKEKEADRRKTFDLNYENRHKNG